MDNYNYLSIDTPDNLVFDYGLVKVDYEQKVQEQTAIPQERALLPAEKVVNPYSGTALDLKEQLSKQVLKALMPKIDNASMYEAEPFAEFMQAADEKFRKLAEDTKNKSFVEAIHVLIEEMALRELLSQSRNALIAV